MGLLVKGALPWGIGCERRNGKKDLGSAPVVGGLSLTCWTYGEILRGILVS